MSRSDKFSVFRNVFSRTGKTPAKWFIPLKKDGKKSNFFRAQAKHAKWTIFFESDFCHEAKSAILKISFLFIFDFFQSSFLSLSCFLPNNGFIWVKHGIVGDLVWPQRFWTQFTPNSGESLNERTVDSKIDFEWES